MQQYDCYYDLGSQASQKTLELLDKNWKSFFSANKDYKKNPHKYLGKPKLPKYKDKKNGRFILMLKNIQCKIVDGYLKFSWKPLRRFTVKTKVKGRLMQVRFVPCSGYYNLEIVYEVDVPDLTNDSNRIAGIDLGINNLATISNNIGVQPFIINGKIIKSVNKYYNKKKAEIQSDLKKVNGKSWSNKLEILTSKRNEKIKYLLHASSRYIINWCIDNQIDTVVVGKNKEWKQESNIGKRNNQNFVSIPYDIFINQLKYKCENVGIGFVETEESYTSGTSFYDDEMPVKENYDKARRITRGLFKSNNEMLINADLNGSYQIIKKVFPNAFSNGIEGVGLHPVRVNIN